MLATLTHDYPARYSTCTATIKHESSPNNTANAVVADRLSCVSPLSLKDQELPQFVELLDSIFQGLDSACAMR